MRLISKLYAVSELSGDALVILANSSDEAPPHPRFRVGAGLVGDTVARDTHRPAIVLRITRLCLCCGDCGG